MKLTDLDPLLWPYWQAKDEDEAQFFAAQLVREQLEPVISSIVKRKLSGWLSLRSEETTDVQSEIILHLLQRLRQLRRDNPEPPIKDLQAYTAVTSYRACAAFLRQRYPNRWRLVNRLRYLLDSQPQFVLRIDENEELSGGLAAWKNDPVIQRPLSLENLQRLSVGPLPKPLLGLPDPSFTRVSPEKQVEAILQWAAHFIALDDLVKILSHWWDVKDQSDGSLGDQRHPQADIENHVGQRIYLQKVWEEITALPVRQRQALLLNLRDMGSQADITLLPALQIASLRDIAVGLELPSEEFAEIWSRLPLEDAEIAARMQVTRRQVINLRKTARERLLRRTRDW